MTLLYSAGGGTSGLPRLKSKTFSAPCRAFIFAPSSNILRIQEDFSAKVRIFVDIVICNYSFNFRCSNGLDFFQEIICCIDLFHFFFCYAAELLAQMSYLIRMIFHTELSVCLFYGILISSGFETKYCIIAI